MNSRERSEPSPIKSKYIRTKFRNILNLDFKDKVNYFFTIKPNHSVALFDNAHDLYKMIQYLKMIMIRSHICQFTYCFEIDSRRRLHVHGFAEATETLNYKRLPREWGVHHKFSRILATKTKIRELNTGQDKIIPYITKNPIGPIIKSFKDINNNNIINTLAYW